MRAVNPNAAGVLLAKRIILQALKEGAAANKQQAQRLRAATGSHLRVITDPRCHPQFALLSPWMSFGPRFVVKHVGCRYDPLSYVDSPISASSV